MKPKFLLIVIINLLLLSACTMTMNRGSGEIVSEEREVSGFTRVSVSGGGELTLIQGETESLKIEADDNLLQYIETIVRNGELVIRIKPVVNIFPSRTINYFVTLPEIESVSLSGGAKLRADDLTAKTLTISMSGGGEVTIGAIEGDTLTVETSGGSRFYTSELSVAKTDVEVSGGGKFQVDVLNGTDLTVDLNGGSNASILGGAVDRQVILMSGGGKYDAPDLKSLSVEIDGSGGSRLLVWAEDNLDASLSGGGRVEYYGKPAITSNMSGGARLEGLGEH